VTTLSGERLFVDLKADHKSAPKKLVCYLVYGSYITSENWATIVYANQLFNGESKSRGLTLY
jgi:hypothetical protein